MRQKRILREDEIGKYSMADVARHCNMRPSQVMRRAKELGIPLYTKNPSGHYEMVKFVTIPTELYEDKTTNE